MGSCIEQTDFFYTKWCDLGIVSLKIHSNSVCISDIFELHDNNTHELESIPVVNIYLCDENNNVFSSKESYREKRMGEGLYLGHHIGQPAKLKIIDDYNMALFHPEPFNIIRWHLSKYIVNVFALKQNKLYLKGGAVAYKGRAFLILGRGGAGKTELINKLCENGASFISNTHLLIDALMVKGINTNIRIRKNGKDEFVSRDKLHGENVVKEYLPISGIFWVKYRDSGKGLIKKMNPDELFVNMQFFSEATVNWEMKEDMADYFNSNPISFGKEYLGIYDRMRRLTNVSAYYVNLDIFSTGEINKVLDLMDIIIKSEK